MRTFIERIPERIRTTLMLVAAVFEQTWVRGTVAIINLLLVIVAGYALFTQGML